MTLVTGMVLVVLIGVAGGALRVPYVALGPGPTFNTLSEVDGTEVVEVTGAETFPTAGNLNLTTVSVQDGITLFGAFGFWVSGRNALVPRDTVYPPDQTEEQTEAQNTAQFAASEDSAEVAALSYLDYPFSAQVAAVVDGAPSDGLLMAEDLVTSVDGTPTPTAGAVTEALVDSAPGEAVTVGFTRDGTEGSAEVVLGEWPDGERTQGYLGISTADVPDVDFEVEFSLSDIGGPSAGLMFSLAVVDKLTEGELNAGQFVAGTGTIRDDAEARPAQGKVGPIGGIGFKLVAAREAGATTFLVPAANCAEAVASVPDGLRLVKVETLAGAVDALETLDAAGEPPSC